MDSKRIVLRENWKFCLEEQGEPQSVMPQEYRRREAWGAWYKGYNDSGWRDVAVPHGFYGKIVEGTSVQGREYKNYCDILCHVYRSIGHFY